MIFITEYFYILHEIIIPSLINKSNKATKHVITILMPKETIDYELPLTVKENKYPKMAQMINCKLSSKFLLLSLILLALFSTFSFAQDGDPVTGKALFNTNCAACHSLDKKLTGPPLRGFEARLSEEENLDREWIYAWIRNSAKVIKSGDAYALKIDAEYNNAVMTAMPQLSDEEINNILAYTAQPKAIPQIEDKSTTQPVEQSSAMVSNELILVALAILFMLLAIGLFLVNKTLQRFAAVNQVEIPKTEKKTPLWKVFAKNQFLVFVVSILFLLASAYHAYGYFMQIGVDQGYQPVQPIHFSHKIHAGDNNIDCKYCHSSARVSKTSGIPSLNLCMNCHVSIYEYTGETTD